MASTLIFGASESFINRNATALIAVIGSVVVAAITAFTASHRQRQQLDHDRLAADLDELRSILDDGLSHLRTLSRILERSHVTLFTPGFMVEHEDELQHAIYDIGFSRSRINLRLGEQHPVSQAFAAAADEFKPLLDLIAQLPDPIPSEELPAIQQSYLGLFGAVASRRLEFIRAAATRFGSLYAAAG